MKTNFTSDEILDLLTEKRRKHTLGVLETGIYLARKYQVNEDKIKKAIIFHDLYRGRSNQELNELIETLNIPESYKDNPNLSHGKIAAKMMERKWKITDKDILNAVEFHTTGRQGMSKLEMVVFAADALEPGRNYEGVKQLRAMMNSGLKPLVLEIMTRTINFLKKNNKEIHKDTLEGRVWLLEEIKNESKR